MYKNRKFLEKIKIGVYIYSFFHITRKEFLYMIDLDISRDTLNMLFDEVYNMPSNSIVVYYQVVEHLLTDNVKEDFRVYYFPDLVSAHEYCKMLYSKHMEEKNVQFSLYVDGQHYFSHID